MIKNLFISLLLLIFSVNIVFAKTSKIPNNLSWQYKQEMEKIINEEYPIIIKNINEDVKYAKTLRDKIIKYGFNLDDYIKLTLIPDTHIPSTDLDLYAQLLKITTEKYLGQEYKPIGTDSSNPLDEFLNQYLTDNNVNRNKLTRIIHYQNKKIRVVESYIKQVEKLRDNDKLK